MTNGEKRVLSSRLASAAVSYNNFLALSNLKTDPTLGIAQCGNCLIALELALKAILAMNGKSDSYLKDTIRHKLSLAFEECPDAFTNKVGERLKMKTGEIANKLRAYDESLVSWRYVDFVDSLEKPFVRDDFDYKFLVAIQRVITDEMFRICFNNESNKIFLRNRGVNNEN